MKSNFLSMVSHELRTPLTSIIGFAKMIRKHLRNVVGSQQEYEESDTKLLSRIGENTGVIIAEGDRLTELINNVLDLAKLEAGFFEWDFVPVSMREALEHSIAAAQVLFDEKVVQLDLDIDPDLPTISGDHDRIVQVCINLLSMPLSLPKKGMYSVRLMSKGSM